MTDIGDPVQFVESRFGIQLRRVGRTEWAGPCPWCGGRDRFRLWDRGNYWCRPGPGHCAKSGWLDELDGIEAPTPEQVTAWRLAALERRMDEHERRLSAVEAMLQCEDHITYHRNLDANQQAVDYWLSEGVKPQTIAERQLGYCPECPTAPGFDSYTIPVLFRGELYNIRHRLCHPGKTGGKYRPHRAGLPAMLYNADDLLRQDDAILILEGEKKSIVVSQETGLPNVATMGAQSFKADWARKVARFKAVYVCYDPDAIAKAQDTARLFGTRGRIVTLPAKADDFFVHYRGTARDFEQFLHTARPA